MPRSRKTETETTTGVLPSRIPNFEDGDSTGLDDMLILAKVTSKKQKDGALTRDCEFAQQVGGLEASWPGRLAPFRAAVDAALEGGPVLNAAYHPKTEVTVDIVSVDGDQQLPVVRQVGGVLRRVKVTAKKGEAEIRWTIRVSKTDGLAQEFEDAQLCGPCKVSTTTVQQKLDLGKKGAETLPPEAGEAAH